MIPYIRHAALFTIGFTLAHMFREYPETRKPVALVGLCILVYLVTMSLS